MAAQNTVKDGSGDAYWQLCDSDGYQLVRLVKSSGHTATQVSADGNIKASAGVLYSLVVAGAGVTAGDTCVITDGSGGSEVFRVVFSGANETIFLNFSAAPITFSSAIYADVTISGGTIHVTGVYD